MDDKNDKNFIVRYVIVIYTVAKYSVLQGTAHTA